MQLLDILIAIGVLAFAGLGFRDGFFKKIFAVVGFLLGLILATKFMGAFAEILESSLGFSNDISNILAFAGIFGGVVILENLSYRWFGQSGSGTLPIWSRFAGAFIGAAQGLVVVSLFLIMLSVFNMPEEETIKDSGFYEPVVRVAPRVFDMSTSWIPESKKFFEELKSKFENFNIDV